MPDIRYTFSAAGQAGVRRAFRSIEQSAKRTKRTVRRSTGMGRGAAAEARKAAAARQREQLKAVKATERAQLASVRRVERAQRQAQQRAARHHLRLLKQQERARLRAERRARREAERTARRQQRQAQSRQRSRSRMIRQIAGRVAGGALRGIGAIGLAATGVAGLAARQGIALQDRATRLAIKGTTVGGRVDPRTLRREAEGIAQDVRGAQAGGVIAAQERFVSKTGRLELAREYGKVFAEIAVATGTEFEAIGSAAADMFEKFDIKSVEDMGDALALLAIQGKRGAFEMEDAAAQFPKIAAAAARFGLRGTGGLATLGGLTQIARRATPSGEEAATAVENMFKQVVAKEAMIKKETGVSVFKDKGKTQTRDIQDLLVEIIGGARGNLPQLQKIFDVRGIRAVSPLISLFNKVRQEKLAPFKGKATPEQEAAATATAMQRLRQEIDNVTNVSAARTEIEEDLGIAQQQTSANLTAAWESLVAQVNSEFTPAITDTIQQIAGFIETTDFSGAGRAFTAMAEAAGLAVDGLEALGIISKKPKTPEMAIKEGQRELQKIKVEEERLTRRVGGPAGFRAAPEARAELVALGERRLKAEAQIAGAREGVFKGDVSDITQQEFVKRFTSAGVNETVAKQIAASVAADPTTAEMTGRGLYALQKPGVSGFLGRSFFGGETEAQQAEQQRLIAQLAQTETARRTIGQRDLTPEEKAARGPGGKMVDIDTDEANQKLGLFANTADTAIAALRRFADVSSLAEAL